MKKLITLALVLASASAFATRSRLNSLGNSPHLVDASTFYGNTSYILTTPDSMTIEAGLTGVNALSNAASSDFTFSNTTSADTSSVNQGAEGFMIRSMGDAKFVVGLGHDDATTFANRGAANAYAAKILTPLDFWRVKSQQNPIVLGYAIKMGDMGVGAAVRYSNYNDKKGDEKETTMGLNLGARGSVWDIALDLGLTDEWSTGATAVAGAQNDSFKGKTNISVSGGYNVNADLYVYGALITGGFKAVNATVEVANYDAMSIKAGAISEIKKDGVAFFYGASLVNSTSKLVPAVASGFTADIKKSAMNMPLIIGLEADATSWLALRGSVTQTLLLVDSSKETTINSTSGSTATGIDTNPGLNSTTLAAGAGLKFNKVSVDGSILAAGSQVLNSASLLGQVGLTYAF